MTKDHPHVRLWLETKAVLEQRIDENCATEFGLIAYAKQIMEDRAQLEIIDGLLENVWKS